MLSYLCGEMLPTIPLEQRAEIGSAAHRVRAPASTPPGQHRGSVSKENLAFICTSVTSHFMWLLFHYEWCNHNICLPCLPFVFIFLRNSCSYSSSSSLFLQGCSFFSQLSKLAIYHILICSYSNLNASFWNTKYLYEF